MKSETLMKLSSVLPPANTKRWVASRKADIVRAIRSGALSRADACSQYLLSDEELRLWERALDTIGVAGLRVTRVQIYRDTFNAIIKIPASMAQ